MIDWHGLVPTESELASDPTSRARAGPGEEGGGSAMGEDEQAREALWLHKGERPKQQALVTVSHALVMRVGLIVPQTLYGGGVHPQCTNLL